jgi:ribosomal protein L37AE/L43A
MANEKCMKCKTKLATIRYKDTKWYCTLCYIDLFHRGDKILNFLLTVKKHLINRDSV